MGLLPPSTVVPGVKQPDLSTVERSVILEKATEILEPKRDHLMAQFARIGLQSRQLVTQEIIQLFYGSYNPEAAEGQQITDTNSYTTPLVEASIQGGTMDNNNNPISPTPTSTTPPVPDTGNQVQPAPTTEPMGAPMPTPNPIGGDLPGAAIPSAPTNQPMPGQQMPPAPAPSMTPPSPMAEPNMPPAGTPTPPVSPSVPPAEAQIQDEINSTLKELGGELNGTPAPGGTPAAQTPAGEADGGIPAPQTTPIPPAQPNPTMGGINNGSSNANAASNSGDTNNLPPLPEI
jgi:hypothetical protein